MGILSLFIVCLLYLVTSWDYLKKEEPGMALAFGAYALANIGFIINLIKLGEKSQ